MSADTEVFLAACEAVLDLAEGKTTDIAAVMRVAGAQCALNGGRRLVAMARAGCAVEAEIAALRADNLLLTLAYRGVTPDANTQTPEQYAATEDQIEAAMRRATKSVPAFAPENAP